MLQEIQEVAPRVFAPHGIKEDPFLIAAVVKATFKEIAVVFSPQDCRIRQSLNIGNTSKVQNKC